MQTINLINLGINGLGRIGKCLFLQVINNPDYNIRVCAINAVNLTVDDIEDYLNYDSVHRYPKCRVVKVNEDRFAVNNHAVTLFRNRDARQLDWTDCGCQVLIDATGAFLTTQLASRHRVPRVIMSAPPRDSTPTYVYGVNHGDYGGEAVISGASCTTNCLAPVLKLLHLNFGVRHAVFTAIHAATASQTTVDIARGGHRTARTVTNNIIPHSTGASQSVAAVIPELADYVHGTSIRVPTVNCSLLDLNLTFDAAVTLRDIEQLVRSNHLYGQVYDICYKRLVSSDFVSTTAPCIIDLDASMQTSPQSVKLVIWYDNEWSYSAQLIRLVAHIETNN